MSDGFDKEAEREKLREKFADDEEERAHTQRMSELLLQGATMTNRHCDDCGDPIFRKDGQEFCPTCHTVDAADAADAGSTAAGQSATSGADGESSSAVDRQSPPAVDEQPPSTTGEESQSATGEASQPATGGVRSRVGRRSAGSRRRSAGSTDCGRVRKRDRGTGERGIRERRRRAGVPDAHPPPVRRRGRGDGRPPAGARPPAGGARGGRGARGARPIGGARQENRFGRTDEGTRPEKEIRRRTRDTRDRR